MAHQCMFLDHQSCVADMDTTMCTEYHLRPVMWEDEHNIDMVDNDGDEE